MAAVVVVVVVVNGLSRALHKLCWNAIQDCWEEEEGERKLFSYKFSAISSQRGSEHLHFSPRVGVRLCWLMMDCPSLCSPSRTKKGWEWRGSKRPQKSSSLPSFVRSPLQSRANLWQLFRLQIAFPAVSLFSAFPERGQTLEQSERGGLSLCPTLRKESTLFGEVDRWTDRNDS